MGKLTNIIVHCSDSTWGNAAAIDKWHKEKGWRCIGYHYVILNGVIAYGAKYDAKKDGVIEKGRPINQDDVVQGLEIGSHCLGYNDKSIGICLIGTNKFTPAQMKTLVKFIEDLMKIHKYITVDGVLGHRETASGKAEGKTCPNFDVATIRQQLRKDLKK